MAKKHRCTLATIVGARPQFIKAAAFSRIWRQQHREILIHTGQHYAQGMSAVFFKELGTPTPNYNLGIRGRGTAAPLDRMVRAISAVLIHTRPEGVLIYGDTLSTLAGALAAAQLQLPVFHVEAGLRSFVRSMPEEMNRLIADHLSHLRFAPTTSAVQNLAREGIRSGVHLVGDIMLDVFRFYLRRSRQGPQPKREHGSYALVTVHRADTADDHQKLASICEALKRLSLPVIWPVHPRTRRSLRQAGIRLGDTIRLIQPVGYLESLRLQAHARIILTDSGGIQKEAYFLRKPCVTLRGETEWIETLRTGHNVIGGCTRRSILAACRQVLSREHRPWPALFGTGHAAEKIAFRVAQFLQNHREN